MIEIQHLYKKFGRLKVLDDISVQLTRGQAVSFIGPNGSGKTTLIKCMLGLVVPDSGTILLDGQSVMNTWAYREQIGYMPQIGRYPENMRVRQVFDMLKNLRGNKIPLDEDLIEAFQVKKFEDKTMRSLSGGTRQKVSACLAFLFNPPILILDEPTAGLDPLSAEILKEKIINEKKKNKLILITSHILSDLDELTTDILYIMDGQIKLYQNMEELENETGEKRLNKSIAIMMRRWQSNQN